MKSDAQKFIDCLDDAVHLLDTHSSMHFSGTDIRLEYSPTEQFDLALFEQWSEFCAPAALQKPPIRIIQHLSCTGGTLIAKCLAAMPNVSLLSEVNPLSRMMIDAEPRFSPTDMTYLAVHGGLPLIDELSEQIFKADIDVIYEHVRSLGQYLVVRDHSHSDFLVGESANESATVLRLLKENHTVLSITTIRHPVDSYLSLLNNGWIDYTPETFDEYCKRYLLFIDCNKDFTTYKYEDFISEPRTQLHLMCESLQLPFNEDFLDIFDLNVMSGDSGRSSNIIEKRDRRAISEDFSNELKESKPYVALCEKMGYKAHPV